MGGAAFQSSARPSVLTDAEELLAEHDWPDCRVYLVWAAGDCPENVETVIFTTSSGAAKTGWLEMTTDEKGEQTRSLTVCDG